MNLDKERGLRNEAATLQDSFPMIRVRAPGPAAPVNKLKLFYPDISAYALQRQKQQTMALTAKLGGHRSLKEASNYCQQRQDDSNLAPADELGRVGLKLVRTRRVGNTGTAPAELTRSFSRCAAVDSRKMYRSSSLG
jgi:hypothetical protein